VGAKISREPRCVVSQPSVRDRAALRYLPWDKTTSKEEILSRNANLVSGQSEGNCGCFRSEFGARSPVSFTGARYSISCGGQPTVGGHGRACGTRSMEISRRHVAARYYSCPLGLVMTPLGSTVLATTLLVILMGWRGREVLGLGSADRSTYAGLGSQPGPVTVTTGKFSIRVVRTPPPALPFTVRHPYRCRNRPVIGRGEWVP
jgi:hypothetical protein